MQAPDWRVCISRRPAAVLISGGETLGVLAAVRALRSAGHEPWVAVHDRTAYAARSLAAAGVVTVPDPAQDERGFVRALAQAASRIPASIVLPGTETALVALARHTRCFPKETVVGVCSTSIVDKATDKELLADLAADVGLTVPRTIVVRLDDLPHDLPVEYPLVVKPPRSDLKGLNGASHHYTARRVDTPEELREAVGAFPGGRALVQRYLAGPLGSLAGVIWNGRMVRVVQSRADRIWPRYCGSMTSAVTVPLDRALCEKIEKLLTGIAWNGLFQVDFVEHTDQSFLIDLNPRMYTSLAITTRAGVNLPAVWVELLQSGDPGQDLQYAAGVWYRHDEDDIRALVDMLFRGPRLAALRGFIPRRKTVHTVFSVRDPLPLLTTLGKIARAAMSYVSSGAGAPRNRDGARIEMG